MLLEREQDQIAREASGIITAAKLGQYRSSRPVCPSGKRRASTPLGRKGSNVVGPFVEPVQFASPDQQRRMGGNRFALCH